MKFIYCNFFKKTFLKKTYFLSIFKCNFKSWSIVFFGSDSFSLFCLKTLHIQMTNSKKIKNIEIVVTNDKNPVYEYSVSNNIKIHFWPPDLSGSYDLGIIASFGKLIPKSLLQVFPLGIINLHGSLLPKYRGGIPTIHAIKNGETLTGITVTKIKEDKFDIGEIILQKSCSIGENEVHPSLYKRLAHLGSECLLEIIDSIPKCLEVSYPQPEQGVSYAPKLNKTAAIIKWKDMTALEVFNLHRALFGTFELTSSWRGKIIKIICLPLNAPDSKMIENEDVKLEPGCFTFNKKTKFFYVQCKDKQITVCTIKYNGKMYTAPDFFNGYLHNLPTKEWKFES